MVFKKEPRSCPKLRAMVNDILEHQQQDMWISQKERSEDGAVSVSFFEERKGLWWQPTTWWWRARGSPVAVLFRGTDAGD